MFILIVYCEYLQLPHELKQRISQRDNFSVQFIVAATAALAAALGTGQAALLWLLPVITVFFSIQVFESYNVHERLVDFIRENLETKISQKCGEKAQDFLWESYCESIRGLAVDRQIGGRELFFKVILLLMPALSFALCVMQQKDITLLTAVLFTISEIISIMVYLWDKRKLRYTGLNKLAYCDYMRKADRTDEPTKAVFLDKDGTLHEDTVMAHRWRDLLLFPDAKAFIKQCHHKGYLVIIVTNQSAIGKGIYSVSAMHRFIWLLRMKLKYVDAVYYCPHKKGVKCACRKPGTGMFQRAELELNVDLQQSIMIGDRQSDMQAGINAGIGRNILVQTGIYRDATPQEGIEKVKSLSDIKI